MASSRRLARCRAFGMAVAVLSTGIGRANDGVLDPTCGAGGKATAIVRAGRERALNAHAQRPPFLELAFHDR